MGVSAPGMTSQEQEVNRNYMNAARAQAADVATQLHYNVDPQTGAWTKMTDREYLESPDVSDVDKQAFQRYKSAVAGSSLTPYQKQQANEELKALRNYGVTGSTLNTAKGTDTASIQRLNAMKTRLSQLGSEQAQKDLQFGQLPAQNIQTLTSGVNAIGQTGQAAAAPYKEQEAARTRAGNVNLKTMAGLLTTGLKSAKNLASGGASDLTSMMNWYDKLNKQANYQWQGQYGR